PFLKLEAMVTIKLHYGGYFELGPPMQYIGGSLNQLDGIDSSMISMTELKQWIDQLGLSENANVYYLVPNSEFDTWLRMILSYTDILVMFKEYEAYDVVCLYVENDNSGGILSFDNSMAKDGGVIQSIKASTCIDDENIEIFHDVQVNLNNDNGKLPICVEDIPIDDEYVLGDMHNMSDSSLDSFEGNEYDSIEDEQEPDDRDACFYASDSDLNDTPLNSDEEVDNSDPVLMKLRIWKTLS
ncbi:hypothetical protein Pfo_011417, partial [Paulownia fortunei]